MPHLDRIYPAIGHVTISVNPYRQIADCTSAAIAQCAREGEDAPPHIVRTATIAYHGLTLTSPEDRQPQSILISGETGAGKTEACKLCLLALAELSGSSGAATEQCLESAVLLEAFGNAKTVYNDNSSRFGKWCAVYFDHKYNIAACQCNVYLLERTRIVHAPKQTLYHIFYQLLVRSRRQERRQRRRPPRARPLTCGLRLLPGAAARVRDAQGWRGDGWRHRRWAQWCSTLEKLDVVGLVDERRLALTVVSAVLALGNELCAEAGRSADRRRVAAAGEREGGARDGVRPAWTGPARARLCSHLADGFDQTGGLKHLHDRPYRGSVRRHA